MDWKRTCPVSITDYPTVVLAHGGGGKLMHDLIEKMFRVAFGKTDSQTSHDSAVLELPGNKIALTTDSFVVSPVFFPGGDIGSLAVNGTVNDLAMSGARPLYLTAGVILEEGFAMQDLWHVVSSMARAAREAGVQIVTGDTKVVDKGKGDSVFINTAGVGVLEHARPVEARSIREGDSILLSGDVGRHGCAIMAVRKGMEFETQIESDCAPLNGVVQELLAAGVEVHCMRDLTRGGLATSLVELASESGLELHVRETAIGIHEQVHAICEVLGLDPMYMANEGRFVLMVPKKDEALALSILKKREMRAGLIGMVHKTGRAMAVLESAIGVARVLDMLSGEQLPRIC